MKHIFFIDSIRVRVTERENYLIYNFRVDDKIWREYYISKSGWDGSLDEIEEVGKNILDKRIRSAQ